MFGSCYSTLLIYDKINKLLFTCNIKNVQLLTNKLDELSLKREFQYLSTKIILSNNYDKM